MLHGTLFDSLYMKLQFITYKYHNIVLYYRYCISIIFLTLSLLYDYHLSHSKIRIFSGCCKSFLDFVKVTLSTFIKYFLNVLQLLFKCICFLKMMFH